jgi:hypothetical protein
MIVVCLLCLFGDVGREGGGIKEIGSMQSTGTQTQYLSKVTHSHILCCTSPMECMQIDLSFSSGEIPIDSMMCVTTSGILRGMHHLSSKDRSSSLMISKPSPLK